MENSLWHLMISNASHFLLKQSAQNPEISIFEISDVLAICTGKLKEDIVAEIFTCQQRIKGGKL